MEFALQVLLETLSFIARLPYIVFRASLIIRTDILD